MFERKNWIQEPSEPLENWVIGLSLSVSSNLTAHLKIRNLILKEKLACLVRPEDKLNVDIFRCQVARSQTFLN